MPIKKRQLFPEKRRALWISCALSGPKKGIKMPEARKRQWETWPVFLLNGFSCFFHLGPNAHFRMTAVKISFRLK